MPAGHSQSIVAASWTCLRAVGMIITMKDISNVEELAQDGLLIELH